MARRMVRNVASTHDIERQGRRKERGGVDGPYTRGESAGTVLWYLCSDLPVSVC